MWCRGIRGATTAEENSREAILAATTELLRLVIDANELDSKDVASAYFSTSPDLNAEFPAAAARAMGWTEVPLICGHEMAVPGSLQKCVRVLIHVNTNKRQDEVAHVYIKGATNLRPDVAPRTS